SNQEVRQPDLVMIHRNRLDIMTKRGIEGTPDLVAEILSAHSARRDRYIKLKTYAKYKIPEYWIVDPVYESLEQYILSDEEYVLNTVYEREDSVLSERLPCVSFTMAHIIDAVADIPG